jgi:hypothetical protein
MMQEYLTISPRQEAGKSLTWISPGKRSAVRGQDVETRRATSLRGDAVCTIVVLALLSISQVQAQDDLPYRPFKSFNNDTIQYLDYNFFIRHAQYKGKKVSDFIKDLELSIVYVHEIVDLINTGNKLISEVSSMSLGIRRVGDSPGSDRNYYVGITLAKPIFFEDFEKAAKYDGNRKRAQWSPQLYELLKDSELSGITTNQHLIEERRKILESSNPNYWEEFKKVVEKETKQWQKKNRDKQ